MAFLVFQGFEQVCDLRIPESVALCNTLFLALSTCPFVHIRWGSFDGFHPLKSVISICFGKQSWKRENMRIRVSEYGRLPSSISQCHIFLRTAAVKKKISRGDVQNVIRRRSTHRRAALCYVYMSLLHCSVVSSVRNEIGDYSY